MICLSPINKIYRVMGRCSIILFGKNVLAFIPTQSGSLYFHTKVWYMGEKVYSRTGRNQQLSISSSWEDNVIIVHGVFVVILFLDHFRISLVKECKTQESE